MIEKTFRKRPIAACVALACISTSGGVYAQDAVLEEVMVTGIRGSLQRAVDVKRDATGVVDAISAEDMGKFPDTNLAESMQRITGVSIDRVNGEGSEVTVRGFGGGFNLITLNGRQMPAANVNTITGNGDTAGSQGTSRSFDFSTLASEGVSGVQVSKTGNAGTPTGGIGATINIETIRPLSAGNVASVGLRGVVDESGQDSLTPEASGMFSFANDDGTFGVSGFASYQDRSSSIRGANVSGYSFFDYDPNLSFLSGAEIDNAPEQGALMALPWNIGVSNAQIDRERVNGMLTAQFSPSDQVTVTVDGLYTSTTLESRNTIPGIWFSRQFSYVEFDGSDVVAIPTRLIENISEPSGRGKDYFFANWADATKDELMSVGVNVEFQASDALTFNFDASTSNSEAGGDGPRGANSWRMNVAAAGAGWQAAYFGGGAPTASIGVIENSGPAGGNGNGILDVGDINTQALRTITSTQEADVNQIQFSGSWDEDSGVSVDFGAGYLSTKMDQFRQETTDSLGGWGVGVNDIPDGLNLVEQICTTCDYEELNVSGYPDVASVIPDGYVLSTLGRESFRVDPYSFAQTLDNEGDTRFDFNNLTQAAFDDNTIEEDIISLYVSASFDGEVAGLTTQTNVGLRYERTEVDASTQQNVVRGLVWTSDNDFDRVFSDGLENLNESHSYSNVLPNLDFSVDITESLKARASISQTIARPQYNDMFITTAVNPPNTLTYLGGNGEARRGNPSLAPLESNNFDLSFEYYYGEGSYASVGYYKKSVNNFVGTSTVSESLFGIRDATSGQAGTISGDAVTALEAGGYTVNEQNVFTMAAILANPADFPGGAADYIDPTQAGGAQQALDILGLYDITATAADPELLFNVSQPVNNETAEIDGIELAWQHFFGESGFGFQANATLVNGDIEYDLAADPTLAQFALTGLSDSANLVLIYEKHGFSARVAYNWRDAFLADVERLGRVGQPRFVDEYSQIDFNISYNVMENLTVSLDGINVTSEGIKEYGRTENMTWWQSEGDARYMLTARYAF